ncbi:MAG TPA: polysaccharide deacetylase family protein, partial [Gaiella sp.]|nr:polysaccharide deacetylase family protein [Gaiella sp.]
PLVGRSIARSLTHPDLTALHAATLKREVAGSRAVIRRRFGVSARFFCYPSEWFDADVIAAVRAAGFQGATTVEPCLAA